MATYRIRGHEDIYTLYQQDCRHMGGRLFETMSSESYLLHLSGHTSQGVNWYGRHTSPPLPGGANPARRLLINLNASAKSSDRVRHVADLLATGLVRPRAMWPGK